MLTLALDTSSASGSLAVLRDERVIACISTSTEEAYSSRLFRHLEFLLRELSLRLEAFDLYAVATGPGSFTGLRVGLAAAKGWAEVYRKPIAAVSGLEAVAAQAHSRTPVVIPVLDARRGQVYAGFYTHTGGPDSGRLALEASERVMTPEEFSTEMKSRATQNELTIATPDPGLIASELSRLETVPGLLARVHLAEVSPILAPEVGRLGYKRAQRGDVVDALTLDANYVRRSDAELHWKEQRER